MRRVSALVILSLTACTYVDAQNDVITGTDAAEDFRGGEGMDTMLGGTGNDTLIGQNGEDTLKGGPGDDRMAGGPGVDIIRGDAGEDILAGGADNDDMQGNVGNDFLIGGPGADVLLGGPGNDTLLGGVGNDTLTAEGGHDVFYGGPGDDILQGQGGADTCVLNPSDDDCVTINLGETCDVNTCLPFAVPVLRADDAIEAVGPSILLPSVEASSCASFEEGTLTRTFAITNLPGDGDTIGVTIANIQGEFEGASVSFSETSCCPSTCQDVFPIEDDGDDDDDDDDDDANDVTFNIPVDDVNGGNVYVFVSYPRSNKDLTFTIDVGDPIVAPAIAPPALRRRTLTRSSAPQTKIGAPKFDTITVPKAPKAKTVSPKKKISTSKKARFVAHNKKQSALITKACTDLKSTCNPNLATRFQSAVKLQKVNVNRSKTPSKKAPYTQRLSPTLSPQVAASVKEAEVEFQLPKVVGPNGEIFVGGAGDDILRGRGGNDRMAGQNGDDTMIGAADADLLLGGNDDDLLIAGPGNDIVQGNAGDDDARGGAGNDTMIGGPGDDILKGGADDDVLAGAVGNDTLRGGAGNDMLDGGEGDDTFAGGMDNDVMFGDDGIDQCLLQPEDAYMINFNSTCDNDLCGPFTEPLINDGTEVAGEVLVATQPAVRFECENIADDLTVEGSQVFAIDTSGFTAPVTVQLDVTAGTFPGSIALAESCCAQTCAATQPLVNGAASLTTTFLGTPDVIYAFVTSFNGTTGSFMVAASEGTPTEVVLP